MIPEVKSYESWEYEVNTNLMIIYHILYKYIITKILLYEE